MPTTRLDLAELFHHRWAVPVLAQMSATPATGRIAALGGRLGAGREILRRTLAAVERLGLVEKNRGYGHPLRPEYLLTARGRTLGAWCGRFLDAIRGRRAESVALRKWSMPVLLAVRRGGTRFSELEATLPGITARALALALKDLQEAGLVDRIVEDDYPPRAAYRVGRAGQTTARLLEEVTRSRSRR